MRIIGINLTSFWTSDSNEEYVLLLRVNQVYFDVGNAEWPFNSNKTQQFLLKLGITSLPFILAVVALPI